MARVSPVAGLTTVYSVMFLRSLVGFGVSSQSLAARRKLAGASSESVSPRKKAGRLIACQIMMTIPTTMMSMPRMKTSADAADVRSAAVVGVHAVDERREEQHARGSRRRRAGTGT